jgi:hypothetical protein
MENLMTPHTRGVGLVTITNVVRKERNIPPNKIKLSSLPLAFMNGVFQYTAKMHAATIVIIAPAHATQIVPIIK